MSDLYTPPKAAPPEGEAPETPRSKAQRWVLRLVTIVGIVAVVAAAFPPVTSDYRPRARISEAIIALMEARNAIAEFYANENRMPKDAAEARIPPLEGDPAKRRLRELRYDAKAGELVGVTQNIHGDVDGRALRLRASATKEGLEWKCYSTDIPPKYLPGTCRE